MHYYQHHIGDFIRDTANLTDSQCMAYLRLIWMYYDTESPLQDSPKTLAFKLGSDAETIELLLEVFFKKDGDSWTHKRIDSEIAAYHQKAQKARESANARWANSERNTDAMRSHSDGNATAKRTQDFSSKVDANQEPITNNQEPENKKPPKSPTKPKFDPMEFLVGEGATEELAEAWLGIRNRKNVFNTKVGLTENIADMRATGRDLNDVLRLCVKRSWTCYDPSFERTSYDKPKTAEPAWMAGGI